MDERSFQRLLRRTVAIPVILLVLLAVTLLVEILTLTSSLKWVDHAEQVISNSRQLMRYMVDMETGVRGYHLTGDKSFLEPYEAAKVPGSRAAATAAQAHCRQSRPAPPLTGNPGPRCALD